MRPAGRVWLGQGRSAPRRPGRLTRLSRSEAVRARSHRAVRASCRAGAAQGAAHGCRWEDDAREAPGARLATLPGCTLRPSPGQPAVDAGLALPDNLRDFDDLCGGATLSESRPRAVALSSPASLRPSSLVIIGERSPDAISDAWLRIASRTFRPRRADASCRSQRARRPTAEHHQQCYPGPDSAGRHGGSNARPSESAPEGAFIRRGDVQPGKDEQRAPRLPEPLADSTGGDPRGPGSGLGVRRGAPPSNGAAPGVLPRSLRPTPRRGAPRGRPGQTRRRRGRAPAACPPPACSPPCRGRRRTRAAGRTPRGR